MSNADLREYVTEKALVEEECKHLRTRLRQLSQKLKSINHNIIKLLETINQPGYIDQKKSVFIDEKTRFKNKSKKEFVKEASALLHTRGVTNPNEVLTKLDQMKKGEMVVTKILKPGKKNIGR